MKAKVQKLLFLVLFSMMFIHCKNEKKIQKSEIFKKETLEEIKKVDIKLIVSTVPKVIGDSIQNPISKIILSVNGKQYDIAKVTGEETKMDQSSAIFPKNSVASCMTWWAGSGDFFYATKVGNKIIIYKGWNGEGNKGDGYNWEITKEVTL